MLFKVTDLLRRGNWGMILEILVVFGIAHVGGRERCVDPVA